MQFEPVPGTPEQPAVNRCQRCADRGRCLRRDGEGADHLPARRRRLGRRNGERRDEKPIRASAAGNAWSDDEGTSWAEIRPIVRTFVPPVDRVPTCTAANVFADIEARRGSGSRIASAGVCLHAIQGRVAGVGGVSQTAISGRRQTSSDAPTTRKTVCRDGRLSGCGVYVRDRDARCRS